MKQQIAVADSQETGRLGVKHLKRFWARTLAERAGSFIEPDENEWRFDNLVFNALGLPIEETVRFLRQTAPSFEELENWILEINGGAIEFLEIERVNCVLSKQPYGENLQNHLREIEESENVLSAEDLRFWDENGYVIIREAVPKEQAQATEKAVWDFLGMNPKDENSWYQKPVGKGIMMEFYHHPLLRENRRSKRIRKAFAQLWKTADLSATTDRTSFNPPETARFPFQGPKLHWDMSLEPPFQFGTQGLLYLCDTPAEQGAFSCVPGFHKTLETWLGSLPENTDPRLVNLDAQAVPIAAEAGDFVIWHQSLPHGSSPNRGKYPRIVQYLNMYPPNFWENPVWK